MRTVFSQVSKYSCPGFSGRAFKQTSTILFFCCAFLVMSNPVLSEPGSPGLSRLHSLVQESRYDEARALGDSLLSTLGDDLIVEAQILDQLVQTGYRDGHTMDPEILAMAKRAVTLKEQGLPTDHPEISTSLMQLANLLNERYECEQALPVYERAAGILRNHDDAHHKELAILLSGHGVALRRLGRYADAQEYYDEALAIQEEFLGRDHADIASTLNNLANIYLYLGDYSLARHAHERALAIRIKHFGSDHEWVGETRNNLSSVLGYMGEYDESLKEQELALAIFRKQLGPDHIRTIYAEMNLGIVYHDMGALDDAILIFEKMLSDVQSRAGQSHVQMSYLLGTLASAHFKSNNYQEALDLYQQCLEIEESANGKDNPESIYAIYEIGRCLSYLGRDDEAEQYLQQSLVLQESLGDLNTPDLCGILNFTAEFDLRRGRLRDALAAAKRSSEIISSRIGRHHPLLAESLAWQARALRSLGNHDEAIALALEAEQIAREHLRATMRVLSESHALGYAEDRVHGLDIALSTLADRESGSRPETVWQMLIRSRAVVLDEMTLRHQRLSETETTETDSLLIRFRGARERLSNLALRGPGWEDVESYHQLLQDARTEINDCERQLALTDARQRDQSVAESLVFDDIRSSLPDDTALVAFIRYLDEPSATGRTVVPTYRAFILGSPTAEAKTIMIGTAAQIDPLVVRWQDHARLGYTEHDAGSGRGILTVANDPATSLAEYRDAGAELRRRIWDPISEHVGQAKRVLIVPDGTLHLVNMASLPVGSDRFLVDEDLVFHTLNTERFLTSSHDDSPGVGVLVVGSPFYGEPADVMSEENTILGAVNFQPLPYTGTEIERVRRMWLKYAGPKVDVLEGAEATEHAFKANARGHRILHLATHGFFVPGGFGRLDIHQPLAYSGLALGGANQWRQSVSGADDGLLTAVEVSSLDLCSVEWAVLSACETGLGSLEARGEGVFGLKRAFTLAGVRTVIMSLWKVDDESSLDWMTALYQSRLRDQLDTAESVRMASRTVLEARRSKGLSAHPYYWAGFTAAGDWR